MTDETRGSECEALLERTLAAAPPATHKPAECQHETFAAAVAVGRMLDTGRFVAEVRIVCVQCREPFRFLGVPAGVAWNRPATSIDSLELLAPVEPEGAKTLQASATYEVPEIPRRH